jgi:hypothetical protein
MIKPGKLTVSLRLIALLYSEVVGEKIDISSVHWCIMSIMKQAILISSNCNILLSSTL